MKIINNQLVILLATSSAAFVPFAFASGKKGDAPVRGDPDAGKGGKGKGKKSSAPSSAPSDSPRNNPSPTTALPTTSPTSSPTELNLNAILFGDDVGGFDGASGCTNDDIGLTRSAGTNPAGKMAFVSGDLNVGCYLNIAAGGLGSSGSAFFEFLFNNTANPDGYFSANIGYRLRVGPDFNPYGFQTNSFTDAMDGLAFLMHQDSSGTNFIGGGSPRYMGYLGTSGTENLLAVELDTYTNTGTNDEAFLSDTGSISEMSVVCLDDAAGTAAKRIGNAGWLDNTRTIVTTGQDLSTIGRLWVEYCGNGLLQVSVDGSGAQKKPDTPQISTHFDATNYWDYSQPMFIGFSGGGAVGGISVAQVVDFEFTQKRSSSCPTPMP